MDNKKLISVKEELPIDDRLILLYTSNILGFKYQLGSYEKENGKFYAVGGLYHEVTHWSYLPDEP